MNLFSPHPLNRILSGQIFGLMGQQIYLNYIALFSRIGGLFLLLMTLILSLGLHYLIIDYGAAASTLMLMILLNIPGLLFVVIPFAGIFASTTLFHRLSQQNELIIMRSVGFNNWRIIRPIAIFGMILALIGWINLLWIVPLSSQTFNKINRSFRTQEVDVSIKPERFNHLGNGMMLYARAITPEHLYLDVLISIEKSDGRSQTLIARTGQFNQDFNNPGFLLRHGSSHEYNPAEQELQVTEFSSYQLKIDEKEVTDTSYWLKTSERFLPDLLNPDLSNKIDQIRYHELITKGHDRMVTPLFFFLLPVLASLLMLHAPFDRRAFLGKILSCVVICFGIFIMQRISLNMAANNIANLGLTYGILLGTICFVILLLLRKQPIPIDLFAFIKSIWLKYRRTS